MGKYESQVKFYHDNGFLVLPNLIDVKDLEPIRLAIEDWVDQLAQTLYRKGEIPSLFENLSFQHRMVFIANYSVNTLNSRVFELRNQAAKSKNLFKFVKNQQLITALTAILGTEISWTGSFAVRVKLPESKESYTPWHQDSHYYGELTRYIQVISVWLPLVDVNEHNGCMHVLPGSHRWGLLEGKRDRNRIVRIFDDTEKRGTSVKLPMHPGDALIFNNLTCHASTVNTTDQIRWSVDIRYVIPETCAVQGDKTKKGYDALYKHYRMKPILVSSINPEGTVPWKLIGDLIS